MDEAESDSGIRKIGVYVNEQVGQVLANWNFNDGLSQNIESLKWKNNLKPDKNYGLKVVAGLKSHRTGMYVTEYSYHEDITDGTIVEIVPALDDVIEDIFQNPSDALNCKNLFSLSADTAFVERIVELNKITHLVSLLKIGNIDSKGKRGCLLTILKLLQDGHLKIIEDDVLETIIQIVLNNESERLYALSVLSQILFIRDVELIRIKEKIVEKVTVDIILPSVEIKDRIGMELSLNALMMINAIINYVHDERRMRIISTLKQRENRERFYNLIKAQIVNDNLARELFVLQTYLLSPYVKNLSRIVSWENLSFMGSNRNSTNMDDEDDSDADSMDLEVYANKIEADAISVSRDTLSRYSLASLSTIRSSSGDSHNPNEFISELTNNCLNYYRKHYKKNFKLSMKEEGLSDPGIARSSERIVQIMAQVLNIGNKIYKKGRRYLPLYFNPETHCFFEEVFIRMMYLLSQNKRKMRAKSLDDFDKVIMGLKKQLELILDRKPDSLKDFTRLMSEVTYEVVCEQWAGERKNEWNQTLRTNPCIIQLSKEISLKNEYLLDNQRMSVLKSGGIFPKLRTKKHKSQYIRLKLSANNKLLFIGDSNEDYSDFKGNIVEYRVDSIRHFVTGQACPHIKDGSIPMSSANLAFSLIFGEMNIDCVAGDEKVANEWIDGFNVLLGNSFRSSNYYKELETLTHLDASIQLVELQNIKIPMKPPPVPPLPPTRVSPAVPPKMRYSRIKSSSSIEALCDI